MDSLSGRKKLDINVQAQSNLPSMKNAYSGSTPVRQATSSSMANETTKRNVLANNKESLVQVTQKKRLDSWNNSGTGRNKLHTGVYGQYNFSSIKNQYSTSMRQAASSNLTKETIKRNVQAIYKESLEQDTQHSSHKSGRGGYSADACQKNSKIKPTLSHCRDEECTKITMEHDIGNSYVKEQKKSQYDINSKSGLKRNEDYFIEICNPKKLPCEPLINELSYSSQSNVKFQHWQKRGQYTKQKILPHLNKSQTQVPVNYNRDVMKKNELTLHNSSLTNVKTQHSEELGQYANKKISRISNKSQVQDHVAYYRFTMETYEEISHNSSLSNVKSQQSQELEQYTHKEIPRLSNKSEVEDPVDCNREIIKKNEQIAHNSSLSNVKSQHSQKLGQYTHKEIPSLSNKSQFQDPVNYNRVIMEKNENISNNSLQLNVDSQDLPTLGKYTNEEALKNSNESAVQDLTNSISQNSLEMKQHTNEEFSSLPPKEPLDTVKESTKKKIESIRADASHFEEIIQTYKANPNRRTYEFIEESLVRLLLRLDNLDIEYFSDLRLNRKEVIKYIQRLLSTLDMYSRPGQTYSIL